MISSRFLLLITYTSVFTVFLLIFRLVFFTPSYQEEKHIEPMLGEDFIKFQDNDAYTHSFSYVGGVPKPDDISPQEMLEEKVDIHVIPGAFYDILENSYIPLIEAFLLYPDIYATLSELSILLFQEKGATRGKMRASKIYMYGVGELPLGEFLSVFIHEYGHYFDIYYFPKSRFGDISDKFYDISWQSTHIMYPGMGVEDFVSGYAMTNKYEDFAETYTYFILHNKEFLTKAEKNKVLMEKYDFFQGYVFPKNQFYKLSFAKVGDISSYYWDITKIEINMEKFLQYLESSI